MAIILHFGSEVQATATTIPGWDQLPLLLYASLYLPAHGTILLDDGWDVRLATMMNGVGPRSKRYYSVCF